MSKKAWWWLGTTTAIIISAFVVWANRYNINDWLVLRSYSPSSQIVSLADNAAMTESGKRLFYVGRPVITSGEEFNEKCRDFEETKVLGCIVSGGTTGLALVEGANYGIYILNVTEPELAGIQEVTAAHEMLHAAYSRLSASQKSTIDEELLKVFNNLQNEKLKAIVNTYSEQDESIITNELHSLLGTEVNNIGPVLEKYYSQYFEDRSKVVTLYTQYESVFDKAKNDAETLYGSIKLLESQILSKKVALESEASKLESDNASLLALRDNGDVSAYNRQVPIYNQSVNSYNQNVAQIRELFNQYNSLIEQYDGLVVKQKQLIDAIDSNAIPEAKL